jgi:hypothetical protein
MGAITPFSYVLSGSVGVAALTQALFTHCLPTEKVAPNSKMEAVLRSARVLNTPGTLSRHTQPNKDTTLEAKAQFRGCYITQSHAERV